MLVETADAAAVAMRITRAEWAALREADIRTAVDKAYKGVNAITFKDAFHRNDIAHRALERLANK